MFRHFYLSARPTHYFLVLMLAMLLNGCGRPAGIIFEQSTTPLVWPQSSAIDPLGTQPRIHYIGQLIGSESLKPAVTGMQALGQTIFGKESSHTMLRPFAVCTDGADRVFVADSNAQCVHVFNLKTRAYQRWKTPADKPQLAQPVGIAYDPIGQVIVSDSVAGELFIFDDQGKFLRTIGKNILFRPCGLTIHPNTRQLLVADAALHQILVFTPNGQLMTKIGKRGNANGEFNFPTDVAIGKQGQIYVCDTLNFRIQIFNPDFTFKNVFGSKGDMPGTFSQPKSIATDSEGHLYVLDAHFEAIQIFDDQNHILLSFGQEGRGPGEFWLPTHISIDANNRIWIADSYNRRIQVLDYLPLTEALK
ncbi:MAG: 6-bladed beta-propeller [Phycisphaeraceae bacterium]|nr:6-bladed beta-propeller [Phycisphaeraceae bacterium]